MVFRIRQALRTGKHKDGRHKGLVQVTLTCDLRRFHKKYTTSEAFKGRYLLKDNILTYILIYLKDSF